VVLYHFVVNRYQQETDAGFLKTVNMLISHVSDGDAVCLAADNRRKVSSLRLRNKGHRGLYLPGIIILLSVVS
jgi:hypothetical protein